MEASTALVSARLLKISQKFACVKTDLPVKNLPVFKKKSWSDPRRYAGVRSGDRCAGRQSLLSVGLAVSRVPQSVVFLRAVAWVCPVVCPAVSQTSLPVSRVERPARRSRCVVCCPRESRLWYTRLC